MGTPIGKLKILEIQEIRDINYSNIYHLTLGTITLA